MAGPILWIDVLWVVRWGGPKFALLEPDAGSRPLADDVFRQRLLISMAEQERIEFDPSSPGPRWVDGCVPDSAIMPVEFYNRCYRRQVAGIEAKARLGEMTIEEADDINQGLNVERGSAGIGEKANLDRRSRNIFLRFPPLSDP